MLIGTSPMISLSWLMLSLLTVPGNRQTNHGSQHASSSAPSQSGAEPGSGKRLSPAFRGTESASSSSRMAATITRLWMMLVEASMAKGTTKIEPMKEPSRDILMVSNRGCQIWDI